MRHHLVWTAAGAGLFLAAAGCLATAAAASGPKPVLDADGVVACKFDAFSTDRDPHGLNVRAGPGATYRVIATLPPPKDDFAAEFSVTGAKDGWFRIDQATVPDYIEDHDKSVFEGVGWVSGRYIGFWLETQELNSISWTTSPAVVDFSKKGPNGEDGGADRFKLERVYDCRGFWVEVGGTYFGKHVRGWAWGICASQVTTCGGGWAMPEDELGPYD
jgi:hypothetical protein